MGNPVWFKSVKEAQSSSNQMPTHQNSGVTEAGANSPTIPIFTPGHNVLVMPNTTQQGLTSALGTQPVAISHVQTTTESPSIPVGATTQVWEDNMVVVQYQAHIP